MQLLEVVNNDCKNRIQREYRLEIEGDPISWKRAGVNFYQKRYYDLQKAEKLDLAEYVKSVITEPLNGPVGIRFKFCFPIPKSLPKQERERLEGAYHFKKPDIDNCEKFLLDAMNAISYLDDCQVADVNKVKIYSSNPRTEITIYTLPPRP